MLDLHRSTYRYRAQRSLIDEAHKRVVQLSERYDYWGYRKIHDLVKGDVSIGRERVRLIRRRSGENTRKRGP